jgi:hypothetical protein
MAFEPKHELPITSPAGDGPWPTPLQLPIRTRRVVDASQNWLDQTANPDAYGDAIVDYYSASIGNFVAVQRRDYSAGIAQYQNRWLQFPGLGVRYQNNGGQELLEMVVQPENFIGGGGTDTNNDGYIALVCTGVPIGIKPGVMTFDLRVNGTSVGSFSCFTDVPSAVVMKFGPTALECQSLADADDANPNSKVAPCLPPRAKTKTFRNTGLVIFEGEPYEGTQTTPPHKDLFGYFIYDWNLLLNQHNNPGSALRLGNFKTTTIDCDPSVIKNAGLNQFRAHLTSTVVNGMNAYFVIESEFYSRADFRSGAQSWNQRAVFPGQITFNDRPLYYAMRCPVAVDLPLNIDLTPQTIDNIANPTPYEAFTGDDQFDGIAPYCNGYWRPGDAPSAYSGQPNDPWIYAFQYVNAYYQFLVNLMAFFNNTYTGYTPKEVAIGDDTYMVTPDFWASPFTAIVTPDDALIASYRSVYSAADDQLSKWKSNYHEADDALTNGSVFYPDPNTYEFVKAVHDDAMNLALAIYGYDTLPLNQTPNETPFWDSSGAADPADIVITNPNTAQIYVRALTMNLMMDSLIGTIIPETDDVSNGIEQYVGLMVNYKLPEN